MNNVSLFSALSSKRIAALMRMAHHRVVYAAPGMQDVPALALLDLKKQYPSPELNISLAFDERTLRMGYGSPGAVRMLREGGIELLHFPGFRSGILIVDKRGWIFTPVAHYLEGEPQSDETPNAIELSPAQVEAFAIRFSPQTREEAIKQAATPEIAAALSEIPCDLGVMPVMQEHFLEVTHAIQTAPPVEFDVIRQVRVFEPYLQYVEMSLTGAAIQKHKVRIPTDIQNLGKSKDLEGRLRTTFALIEKSSALSSKELEEELNEIRKTLTRTLGKEHGRVILKSAKPTLDARISTLQKKLVKHREIVGDKLSKQLADSRKQVVDYYLPLIAAKPPDAVIGQSLSGTPTKDDCRRWIDQVLEKVFPSPEKLIQGMTLEVTYKEVTFETLNRTDFLESVKKAYPNVNWDKTYKAFKAAGEKQTEVIIP